MSTQYSSVEIHLVVRKADAVELTEALAKDGIPFEQGRPHGGGVLGYDLGSLVQIAVHGGAFAALSGVLVAYLKHRKRIVHLKRSDGRIELRTDNLGTKEVNDILAGVEGKDQMWLLEQPPQRAVKAARAKTNRQSAGKSKRPTRSKATKLRAAERAAKPAKAKKKRKAARPRSKTKRAAR
jgi:hypothetical protein